MPTRQKFSSADRLYAGSAYKGGLPDSIPGVNVAQMVVVRWGTNSHHGRPAPAVAAANNVCAAQAIAGAVDALVNGALASGGVATLDVPRNLQMVSSNAGDTTQSVTVRGTDEYGEAVTETRALNGTTIITLTKAFKKVTRVSVSAALAGNLTMGTSSRLGLPFRMRIGDLITVKADNAVEVPTTISVADTSAPTAATNDIRGTVLPSTAMNGTVQFTMVFWVPDTTQDAVGGDAGQFGS